MKSHSRLLRYGSTLDEASVNFLCPAEPAHVTGTWNQGKQRRHECLLDADQRGVQRDEQYKIDPAPPNVHCTCPLLATLLDQLPRDHLLTERQEDERGAARAYRRWCRCAPVPRARCVLSREPFCGRLTGNRDYAAISASATSAAVRLTCIWGRHSLLTYGHITDGATPGLQPRGPENTPSISHCAPHV